jgi:undecaprenyl-diphosphatase
MLQLIQGIDNSILNFIRDNMHGKIMDNIMVLITSLGNSGLIWIIIALALIVNKKYRNVGYMALVALLLSSFAGDIVLKNIVHRLRPSTNLSAGMLLIDKPLSYSFPSGHAMSSFAVAGVLATQIKKYSVWVIGLAALIAFSRLYLYVHYPSDVLAGMLLGFACSYITVFLYNKYFYKYLEKNKK